MKKYSKMISKCVLATVILSCFNSEKSWGYNPYQIFRKDRIDIELTANYFKSEINFGSDGTQQNLTSGNYFQNIDMTPTARWEYFEDIGFVAGLNVAASESSDPLTTRKNSIVNRVDLGADYLFWNSDIHETFVRFIYSHPLEKNSGSTDSVSTSDGATEIKPEIIMRFNLDGLYPYVQGGLNYRSEGLSTLATYGAGIELRFSEIGLGAAILGRASIKDDDYTNSIAVRDAVNNRVNGGSKKYFSVNPNSTDLELSMVFSASENLLFKLFGGSTLIGSNSAVGYNAGLSVNFNFDDEKYHSTVKRKNKSKTNENLNVISREPTPNDFKEDTNDGVNQEYFKPVSPAQKSYINKVEGKSEAIKNATDAEPVGQSVQSEPISKTEYSIKLKQKKSKKKKGN